MAPQGSRDHQKPPSEAPRAPRRASNASHLSPKTAKKFSIGDLSGINGLHCAQITTKKKKRTNVQAIRSKIQIKLIYVSFFSFPKPFIPKKESKHAKKFSIGDLSGINGLHCAQKETQTNNVLMYKLFEAKFKLN